MNKDLEFKELWNVSTPTIPNEEEIIKKVQALKRKIQLHAGMGIMSLLLTIGVIVWVLVSFNFEIWTTKTGIILVVTALTLGILNAMRTLMTPSNTSLQSNKDYLEQLIIIKDQQHFTHTILMRVYFAFLTVGMLLYMYEFALKMPGIFGWIAYGLTISWMAFAWFYWGPKIIKKQRAAMDETIGKLREVINYE